jgi:serine/threonine protein phosphatase PrpC/serine/threonine protein kinase
VNQLHHAEIIHRDIKLSNILLNTEQVHHPKLLLADFSSAVSDWTLRNGLYGELGPTRQELTEEYEAPEIRLQSYLQNTNRDSSENTHMNDHAEMYSIDPAHPVAYDVWTVGVLMLEMILGTPYVFDVDQRAAALIHQRLQAQHKKRQRRKGRGSNGLDSGEKEEFDQAYKTIVFLTALSEYCIYDPDVHWHPTDVGDDANNKVGNEDNSTSKEGQDRDDNDVDEDRFSPLNEAIRMFRVVSRRRPRRSSTMSSSTSTRGATDAKNMLVPTSGHRQQQQEQFEDRDAADVEVCDADKAVEDVVDSSYPVLADTDSHEVVANTDFYWEDDEDYVASTKYAIVNDITESIQPTMRTHRHTQDSIGYDTLSSRPLTSPRHRGGHHDDDNDDDTRLQHCDVARFRTAILRRDSLGLGFNDEWGLDLLQRLLNWDPAKRIAMADALHHAYFVGPYISTVDGSHHATKEELLAHDKRLLITDGTSSANEEGADGSDGNNLGGEMTAPVGVPATISVVNYDRTISTAVLFGIPEQSYVKNNNGHHQQNLLLKAPRVADDDADDDEDLVASEQPPPAVLVTPGHHLPANTGSMGGTGSQHRPFACPKCNRTFDSWSGCISHTHSRKHAKRCVFNPSFRSIVPPCITQYALHPLDPDSGWCDLQGRRRHIEDVHAVAYNSHLSYLYFGVFDGHFGSRTARLVSKYLHKRIEQRFYSVAGHNSDRLQTTHGVGSSFTGISSTAAAAEHLQRLNPDLNMNVLLPVIPQEEESTLDKRISVSEVRQAITDSFLDIDNELLLNPNPEDKSGAAVAILFVFEEFLVTANLGDCRVVLCCAPRPGKKGTSHSHMRDYVPVQLTVDHTPKDPLERARVVSQGGFISKPPKSLASSSSSSPSASSSSHTERVNGILAVTRSFGDKGLKQVISASPDVQVLRRHPIHSNLSSFNHEDDEDKWHSQGSVVLKESFCGHYIAAVDWLLLRQQELQRSSSTSELPPQRSLAYWQAFAIVASDGFWDVITNNEATELACEYLLSVIQTTGRHDAVGDEDASMKPSWMTVPTEKYAVAHIAMSHHRGDPDNSSTTKDEEETCASLSLPVDAFQNAATLLAQEAWLRGSTDNIGVNIVNLKKL